MRKFEIDDTAVGQRADVFVSQQFPEFSRSALAPLFEGQYVRINDEPAKPGQRLHRRDKIKVDDRQLHAQPADVDLPVLFEDDDVIVIDKPAGILTHAKGAINTESSVATFIRPKISRELEGNRAGIVHRLDRSTSGVIIAAKTPAALKSLQRQFSSRKVIKRYLALVEGSPAEKAAIIDAPIARNPKKPQTFTISSRGKPAITEYRIIKSLTINGKNYSLLELLPATGRTHQLRVHLKHLGYPIVGDPIYGHGGDEMMLHAKALELNLPSGERRFFEAKSPEHFSEIIRANHD